MDVGGPLQRVKTIFGRYLGRDSKDSEVQVGARSPLHCGVGSGRSIRACSVRTHSQSPIALIVRMRPAFPSGFNRQCPAGPFSRLVVWVVGRPCFLSWRSSVVVGAFGSIDLNSCNGSRPLTPKTSKNGACARATAQPPPSSGATDRSTRRIDGRFPFHRPPGTESPTLHKAHSVHHPRGVHIRVVFVSFALRLCPGSSGVEGEPLLALNSCDALPTSAPSSEVAAIAPPEGACRVLWTGAL